MNYETVLATFPVGQYFINSVLIAVGSTLLSLTTGSLAAYSLTIYRFRACQPILLMTLLMRMLPGAALGIPLFYLFSSVRLTSTLQGLILAHTAIQLPRTDLYAQVRANAERAGKEIIFINELNYQGGLGFALQSELKDNAPRDEFLRLIDFIQRDPPTLLSPHRKRDDEINGQQGYANTWGVPEWVAWLNSVLNRRTNSAPPFAYSSGQISSHDNGWEGFESDNPYVAQGSRMIFGYGALFSGLVPIWVSGEEFNAPFKPLPTLSPNLFGGANPGQGKWLYGGVVQWDALDHPENRAILDDVRRLIAIRKAEADVLGAAPNFGAITMRPLEYRASAPTPRPYLRYIEGRAVIVAPNM